MPSYKINIDKKVLRILGSQLYGDTPSIIAELVQNAYDSDARRVWITLNTKDDNTIIVQDDGIGMTPDDVNDRFLNIGADRRDLYPESPSGRKVLGRKGIGKLAVFSLSRVIEIFSTKDSKIAACRLDYDEITLNNADPETLPEKDFDIDEAFLSVQGTGTKIVLKDIRKDISKSFNYIVNRLSRTFDVNDEELGIFVRKNDSDFFKLSRMDINFFEYMDSIITFGNKYSSKIDLIRDNGISQNYKYVTRYETLCETNDRFRKMPFQIEVLDKAGKAVIADFRFEGWIGTIHERASFKELVSKEYQDGASADQEKTKITISDNRITIFSRGKIGEFDILPKVQTNRIADAYVVGELYADVFEDDRYADMAISNRRGYDESDSRYGYLIDLVREVVKFITREKEKINKKKKDEEDEKESQKIKAAFEQRSQKTMKVIEAKFTEEEKRDFDETANQFSRAVQCGRHTKKIFISHKSECRLFGELIVRCFELVGVDPKENIIFTSVPELGVPFNRDIYDYLKDCFRDDLYVIFIFSRSFYNSNICISETGAAWATNKKYCNVVVDIGFGDIDKPINGNQIGVRLNPITEESKFQLTALINDVLGSMEFAPIPDSVQIRNAVERAILEFKSSLVVPDYLPNRKFLAIPKCPICNTGMMLSMKGGAALECSCSNCNEKIEGELSM